MGAGPTSQMRGAGNTGDQPVSFRMSDAERIASAVYAHESGRRPRKSSTLSRASGNGAAILVSTFIGSWPKNGYRTIELESVGEVEVKNRMESVPYSSVLRVCFISTIAGEYTLLRAECL